MLRPAKAVIRPAKKRQNIRRRNPRATESEIDRRLNAWLQRADDPVPGDTAGAVRIRERDLLYPYGSFAVFVGGSVIRRASCLPSTLEVSGFRFQVSGGHPGDTVRFLNHTARDPRPHANVGR